MPVPCTAYLQEGQRDTHQLLLCRVHSNLFRGGTAQPPSPGASRQQQTRTHTHTHTRNSKEPPQAELVQPGAESYLRNGSNECMGRGAHGVHHRLVEGQHPKAQNALQEKRVTRHRWVLWEAGNVESPNPSTACPFPLFVPSLLGPGSTGDPPDRAAACWPLASPGREGHPESLCKARNNTAEMT